MSAISKIYRSARYFDSRHIESITPFDVRLDNPVPVGNFFLASFFALLKGIFHVVQVNEITTDTSIERRIVQKQLQNNGGDNEMSYEAQCGTDIQNSPEK